MSDIKGQQGYSSAASEYNAADFQMQQLLRKINTAEPVRVTGVSGGKTGKAGTVTVQPLVNLVTGAGQGMAQSQLYQLPFFRLQGGDNACIIDPKPGDIGLAVYAMRDTETIKANADGQPRNPGSARMYSKGDGFYVGGFLNRAPKRYVRVEDDGITVDDGAGGRIELKGGKLTITAPAGYELNAAGGVLVTAPTEQHDTGSFAVGGAGATATMRGDMRIEGSLSSTGDQVAAGISQTQHTHTGVMSGPDNTGKPQ